MTPKRRRSRGRRSFARVSVLLLLALGTACLAIYLWALLGPLPGDPLSRLAPGPTVFLARDGSVLYAMPSNDRDLRLWVGLQSIAPAVRAATVATEDGRFYDRPIGLDPIALARAGWQMLRGGSNASGGSTIDEQLARTLYLAPERRADRSLTRKAQEWVWALRLAHYYSQDRLLELYLNAVDYGSQAVGIEAAAQTYFGRPARDLDLAQAALLAGLPQSPTRYDPLLFPAAALARRNQVLELMRRHGSITRAEAEVAAAQPLGLVPLQHPLEAPHLVDMVREELRAQLGEGRLAAGGLAVHTTLDPRLQRAAEDSVKHGLAALEQNEVSDGAAVVLDPHSGEVLALVGSGDYFDAAAGGNVNGATALRQPGSAIKPLVYAAALSGGMTAATELDDVHRSFDAGGAAYEPSDYDNTFHGPVPLRVALASSLNVPAVEAFDRTGRSAVLQFAEKLGLGELADSSAGLSLALGGGEVRLLDLTAAYAAFDDGGNWHRPQTFSSVVDGSGRTVLRAVPGAQQAVSPQVAFLITDILADDDARALGFGYHSALELDRPAAVKTGTTSDFRDNWTVGYTPGLAVGVWTGNADGHPMRNVSGVSGAAPIWHEVLERVMAGRPAEPFSRPEGLSQQTVCAPTGLLPGPACPRLSSEWFIDDTSSVQTESYYRSVAICPNTGLLFTADCAQPALDQVFPFPGPAVAAWMQASGIALPPVPPYRAGAPSLPLDTDASRGGPGEAIHLVILSPDTNSTFHMSPELPASQQALTIEAGLNLPAAGVRLLADGAELAMLSAAPYRAVWPLTPGAHTFDAQLLDADGQTGEQREVHVTVLP